MIREHAFDSAWWGAPVGIIDDSSLLDGPVDEKTFAPWAWVELRCPLDRAPSLPLLQQRGFMQVDTQIGFRVDLRRVVVSPSAGTLSVAFADQQPLSFSEHRPFVSERYLALPGMTQSLLDRRYRLWAEDIARTSPAWALELRSGGRAEGWFLAQQKAGALDLTLAMLSTRATISGSVLYARAMAAYRERGATLGGASFSVRNTAVLNIYASLGARFTGAVGHWIRLGGAYVPPNNGQPSEVGP